MTNRNCLSETELLGFHNGLLSENQAESVAEHLHGCPACEETLSNLEKQTDTLVRRLRKGQNVVEEKEDPLCEVAVKSLEPLFAAQSGPDRKRPDPIRPMSSADNSSERDEKTPAELREYRLLEKLGEGGMGAVYKAVHTKLDKVVALKILPPDRMQDEKALVRFEREMKAVGKLDNRHIVRATDAGEVDGTHFLVMEYVDGIDLSRTAITDQGLLQLSASPVIELVDVRQTKVTPTAIAALKSLKPECEILSDFTPEEIRNAPPLYVFDSMILEQSPLDALQRDQIDPQEWKVAGNGDPANSPDQLVGILGESRLQHPHLGPNGPHLAFSSNGKSLVSAGFDGRIIEWDVESGEERPAERTFSSRLTSSAVSEDGRYLVVAEADGDVTLVDMISGEIARQWQTGIALSAVTIHSGLGIVYVGQADDPYRVRAYSMRTGELLAESNTHYNSILKLSISANPDYSRLCSFFHGTALR